MAQPKPIARKVFDEPHAVQFTDARVAFFKRLMPELIRLHGLKSALDVGCGVGYFSRFLHDLGLDVLAVDGRKENIDEARARHPSIEFATQNVEESSMRALGTFDFSLCIGLLYHLENPFSVIRNLHAVTGKVLLVESMVVPGSEAVSRLFWEGPCEDQSLNYFALIPSVPCLIKMLYSAGFPHVYGMHELPDHHYFKETPTRWPKRTMMLASKEPLNLPLLYPLPEPQVTEAWSEIPWTKERGLRLARMDRFMKKPWREKFRSVTRRIFKKPA